MTEILSMFTGNPLATFIGKRIEAATRPELESDDWALNLEICDMINENDDDAKDAIRAIKKRLQQIEHDRDFRVTNRTLTVLETCVSNCSRRFHVLVMSKDFIQDLVKLIGPKNNPPIDLQERVLRLIERWADTFRNEPNLSGVVNVYNDLKSKGVTFPPKDPNANVPIQTPQRSVPQQITTTTTTTTSTLNRPTSATGSAGRGQSAILPQPSGPVVLEGEGYNKISQDLSVVQTSVEMFNDIMRILETNGEESDWLLAADLNTTCRQMKDRIVDLIERVANEDLTIELLRLNDDLNNIFIKYDRLLKNNLKSTAAKQSTSSSGGVENIEDRVRGLSTNPVANVGKQQQQPTKSENELSLIDFNVEDPTGGGGDRLAATTKDLKASKPNDPFSSTIAASSSNVNQTRTVDSLASQVDKMKLDGLEKGSGAEAKKDQKTSGLPEEISSVREQDFAEIENWLSTDSGQNLGSFGAELPSIEPISIPNSEFENFIATRALAGSSSSQPQGNSTKPNQQSRPEPSV